MIPRRSLLSGAFAVFAAAAVAACASQPYAVDGTVSYRERLILPADSVIMVRLEDVTRGMGAPVPVAEQRIIPNSSGVLRYSIPYSPQAINPNGTYVMNAWIEQGGRVLFRNNKLYQVITKGAPNYANIELEQVVATVPGATVVPSSTVIMQQPATTGTVVQPTSGTTVVQPAGTTVVPASPPPGSIIVQPVR
ncbi:MAG TPA: YbaY family lipoprotein [Ferrovibrio sp.]|uniref:YbaY family lipoprotein n=1 Tax=Ferrovibrio sp. TaxID=1917215 RepID=UPI002B4B8E69|nr:YbaY family lipoprotein [Ferrovibrio sp.]HLT78135.1 YbaY family lipoprotein [Ferrovibrio sp.]